ncbi:MAG: hypothetical protein GX452_05525 [Ignavibacteriales bacterium]|nr:hypothetical protein [Ignavibacteriaceae bacterium]NLH60846.1 hypothetical protein [Ignavibacteriales bacterium]
MRRFRTLGILFFLILVFSVSYSESPMPIFYRYYVSGSITGDTLKDFTNFSITLWGKNIYVDSAFVRLYGSKNGVDSSLSFPDTSGKYLLIITNSYKLDSLKAVLMKNDSLESSSEIKAPLESLYKPIISNYFIPDRNSGCGSCSVEHSRSSRIIRYEYIISGLNINLPW